MKSREIKGVRFSAPETAGTGPAALAAVGKARALLKSWLAEDVNTTDGFMELLKAELDKDRESGRKLFP